MGRWWTTTCAPSSYASSAVRAMAPYSVSPPAAAVAAERAVEGRDRQRVAFHQVLQVVGLACVPAMIDEHLDTVEAGFSRQGKDAVDAVVIQGSGGQDESHGKSLDRCRLRLIPGCKPAGLLQGHRQTGTTRVTNCANDVGQRPSSQPRTLPFSYQSVAFVISKHRGQISYRLGRHSAGHLRSFPISLLIFQQLQPVAAIGGQKPGLFPRRRDSRARPARKSLPSWPASVSMRAAARATSARSTSANRAPNTVGYYISALHHNVIQVGNHVLHVRAWLENCER